MKQIILSITSADIARFWSHVDVRGADECWPWTGGTDQHGYGRFCCLSDILGAHQVAAFLFHGLPCPEKPFTLHTCDNPPCCNGLHLFYGTQADNMRDAREKGRITVPRPDNRGTRNGQSKLTDEQIGFIRTSSLPRTEIAAICGVHWTLVYRIRSGKAWRHVD